MARISGGSTVYLDHNFAKLREGLLLKFHRDQIPQRRVRAFLVIHLSDKVFDAVSRLGYIHFES